MPHSTRISLLDDHQLLLAAQLGDQDAGNAIPARFNRLFRKMLARIAPYRASKQTDFVDDVFGETFRQILDPNIKRFSPIRGTAQSYLFGLIQNSVRIITRQRRPVCVDLDDRPKIDIGSRRSAGIVHSRFVGVDCTMNTDLDVEDEMSIVFNGADPMGGQMAMAYYGHEDSQMTIGNRWGVSHTTVGRKIGKFVRAANGRLATAGAA